MKQNKRKEPIFKTKSIQTKLAALMVGVLVFVLLMNLYIYLQINSMVREIDSVFASNVATGQLSEQLELVQDSVYEYLNTKSSVALEKYYRYAQDYQDLEQQLNDKNVDSEIKMLEKNIRNMSESFLEMADETVQAKRGRNVERYKSSYQEQTKIYKYINTYIYEMNNAQFHQNSDNYQSLLDAMRVLEISSIIIIVILCLLSMIMATAMIQRMINPLRHLSEAALKVAEGNFDIEVPESVSEDEVGIVTNAFRKMVFSIREYIERIRTSMEKEAQMKERELSMEAHLKEAQLKYLQAQINPHFLFNSLNAGAQLALMEDAESTGVFMEKMADFFRYNVRKMDDDSTLEEEIQTVDNYIYILNVRFAGDITYEKHIEAGFGQIRIPSMLLQPIVENAVQHGIHDHMEEGVIQLGVVREEDRLLITIKDNGIGMTREQIAAVMKGKHSVNQKNENSTGIGMDNVINRLKLYYGQEDLLSIQSDGKGLGTEIMISLPLMEGDAQNVQSIDCG